jgi:hypothetical protein
MSSAKYFKIYYKIFYIDLAHGIGKTVSFKEGGSDKGAGIYRKGNSLPSASIPNVFPPVIIEVEANGQRNEEMHADVVRTSGFFFISRE